MFVLLILFGSYKLCSAVAFYLRAYAPTNIALDYFRSRRGLKWALPAALVLTPAYWGAGYAVTTLIENGGPGWLNLLAALCALERHQVRAAWPLESRPALALLRSGARDRPLWSHSDYGRSGLLGSARGDADRGPPDLTRCGGVVVVDGNSGGPSGPAATASAGSSTWASAALVA